MKNLQDKDVNRSSCDSRLFYSLIINQNLDEIFSCNAPNYINYDTRDIFDALKEKKGIGA